MKLTRLIRPALWIAVLAGLGFAAFRTQDRWRPYFSKAKVAAPEEHLDEAPAPDQAPKVLKISEQARKNLGIISKATRPQTYWETIQIPGVIIDRPGSTDRGVTAPAAGVIAQVHALPGDIVRPGDLLFTVRLSSEYLQTTQSALFKASKEIELSREQYAKLEEAFKRGSLPESKLFEINQEVRRQEAMIEAHRQDLLTRGLTDDQVDSAMQGEFVATIEVRTPATLQAPRSDAVQPVAFDMGDDAGPAFELQELKAELGEQVAAGQLLATLANHKNLYIEGHAFKPDAPALEHAATQGWPIQVEFADQGGDWPAITETFQIRHFSNAINPIDRTFDFFIPLTNHSRVYERNGTPFVVWRFRPGQRVRLHVPVRQLENVLVVPSSAIAREGPEAYVFRQNGDLFNRLPVHVLHEDRQNVVLANDGSVNSGAYLAQSSGASLNRVLKAQAASGVRADVHVHADGTVHASH